MNDKLRTEIERFLRWDLDSFKKALKQDIEDNDYVFMIIYKDKTYYEHVFYPAEVIKIEDTENCDYIFYFSKFDKFELQWDVFIENLRVHVLKLRGKEWVKEEVEV